MSPFLGTVFHAQGKLLLTGEYFVLDGAMALALPTRLGQNYTWKSRRIDLAEL